MLDPHFDKDEVLCPNCDSAHMQSFPFDSDAPVEKLVEEEG
jgi:hypothetical protein